MAYSHLLDTCRRDLLLSGKSVCVFSRPWSRLSPRNVAGYPLSMNGPYARMLLHSYFFSLASKTSARDILLEYMHAWWCKVFEVMQPTIVIAIEPDQSLCAAGKKLGVQIYDLQHGILEFGDYYFNLRAGALFEKSGTPDLMICWNQASADLVSRYWPWVRTLVTGNLWQQRFLAPRRDQLVIDELKVVREKLKKNPGRSWVLLTMQWSPLDDDLNVPLAVKDAITISIRQGVQWLIRFHPVQVKRIGHSRLCKLAEIYFGKSTWDNIVDVSSCALPAVLPFTRYHVTGSSASTFEASCVGIKTGLWDHRKDVANWFHDLIEAGLVEFLPDSGFDAASKIINESLVS